MNSPSLEHLMDKETLNYHLRVTLAEHNQWVKGEIQAGRRPSWFRPVDNTDLHARRAARLAQFPRHAKPNALP